MKKAIVLFVLLIVLNIMLANGLDTKEENVTWSVTVFITLEDGTVPNGENHLFSGSPGEVPRTICNYQQNGLHFATWFTDMSDCGNQSSVMIPGDAGAGHSYYVFDETGFYGFNMSNFYTQDRTSTLQYDGASDTLHIRLTCMMEGTQYVWAIDTVITAVEDGMVNIYAEMEACPHPIWNWVYYDCFCYEGVEEPENTAPTEYEIAQNSPNPFNSTTDIDYSIPEHSNVTLDVFDIGGRHIKGLVNENLNSGRYSVKWDGTDESGSTVPSGTYFYKIKAGDYEAERKMLLVK